MLKDEIVKVIFGTWYLVSGTEKYNSLTRIHEQGDTIASENAVISEL